MRKIKIGFIGLGPRGKGFLSMVARHFQEQAEVVAVCDVYPDRAEIGIETAKKENGQTPKAYVNYEELLADKNVEMVVISAAWEAHIPLAIAAMRAGKITAMEVGGAYSLDDCWELVRTQEQTKMPFVFMENCCYGERELFVTNMVRNGALGEISYCHGSYCHDLRDEICDGVKNRHYRLRNYLSRNCDNYPTHQLGPIAKLLNVNRGNRLLTISTMASKSRGLSAFVQGKEEYAFLQDKTFAQGDVVQSLIKCADGTLISLKLDTTLPRAYSREFSVSGTKGLYSELGDVCLVEGDGFNHHMNMSEYYNTAKNYKEKYQSPLWRNITQEEKNAGHGGMDYLMFKDIITKVINGEEMPMDVYDAATWMSITCLSEASIAKGGAPVEIPDFTSGNWIMREPKDVVPMDKNI